MGKMIAKIKPESVPDFAHKASSILSVAAAVALKVAAMPTPASWVEVAIYAAGALGLSGILGNLAGKK
jgi:hypothetical protein